MTSTDARVFLHIGEPKTGSTFLQQVLWGNRGELAAQGVRLPGHHAQDHYRATQDLLDVARQGDDPTATWSGEWNLLAEQALAGRGNALISHELFCAASADQAARAVESLGAERTHVVLTVRDMSTLLPAEWQESVKQRYAGSYQEWLGGVIDEQSPAPDRRSHWFWRVHDTLAIVRAWGAVLPADQLHVVVTPGSTAPSGLLWQRFCSVIGIEPEALDVGRARRNPSLGAAEVEFLRRFNAALPPAMPQWFYLSDVKEPLAHEFLARRAPSARLVIPPERVPWAKEQNDLLWAGLQQAGVHVVGDRSDLGGQHTGTDYVDPSAISAADLAELALGAAVVLSNHHFQAVHVRADRNDLPRGLLARIEGTVASSPRLKHAIRTATARSSLVRKLRVFVWRQMERMRGGRSG